MLAFSIDYYGMIFRATQSVELFCAYLISTWIGFLTIILMSIILGDILFGIIYLIYIVPIRMYVGGYHAKSYMKCNIVFLLFFTIALVCYRNLEMVNLDYSRRSRESG